MTAGSEVGSVTAVAVSNSKVTLTLASAVAPDQTVTVSYTPATNPIRDRAQNPAIALTNLTVANQNPGPDHQYLQPHRAGARRDRRGCAGKHLRCCNGGPSIRDHPPLSVFQRRLDAESRRFFGLTALTSLDLSGNQLGTLPENLFNGLTALRILRLGNNQLSTVDENLFEGLTSLEDLSLYANRLSTLPENLFDGLTALRILVLSANQLGTLPENLFDGLTALTSLVLYDNQLSTLPENLFDGLTALTSLGWGTTNSAHSRRISLTD